MAELINMHGYGVYVWSCYGITAVLVGYNILKPFYTHKKAVKVLKEIN